ncbi:hypothetical protein CDL15_Pgr025543 [Punica granatum]|uniref:Uncharacterized protein n=1 Tax=Punica granatum TaxID=22663 RepID=A0A218WA05_PUNGR|nr:hypothetical protein CDL15_Pgr025543 [Punica granatum]
MACDLKGANKEPEAVECPEGKKQKRVVIVGLRSSLGLDKQKQEAVADTPKKRNKPSGTMFTGRSIQTHQLRKGTEEAISSEPESVARDVVSSPSKNKVTSFTCAGGCISDQEFKSTCANWRTLKLQRQREEARRKIESMTCTAGFQDNLDSMREFEKLMGIKSQWMTT